MCLAEVFHNKYSVEKNPEVMAAVMYICMHHGRQNVG